MADWVPRSQGCGSWHPDLGTDDEQCLASVADAGAPGALGRGGFYTSGTLAGPLWINGAFQPSDDYGGLGFRCAR